MIEAGLVYIHFDRKSSGFVGCGALVEGPFVVTCRHVWDQARGPKDDRPVLVCFPPPEGKRGPVFEVATLADACDPGNGQPDLVILRVEVPLDSSALSVARAGVPRGGPAAALAGLQGRDTSRPHDVEDVVIHGSIEARINAKGLCQFTGANGQGYWTDRGASGSPLVLDAATALAGILCLSETGGRPGEAELHEAFVLPASTIHAFLRAHVGRSVAEAQGVDILKIPAILDLLGASELSLAELRRRLDAYFANVKELAAEIASPGIAEAAMPSEDGATAALGSARALGASFEPVAALAVLDEALAKQARTSGEPLLLLLNEKARQQQLLLDHHGAIACLAAITVLSPDSYREWISLGDTRQRVGNLKAAIDAYRGGLGAATRLDRPSDAATAHQRIGAAFREMGDLAGALAEARAGFGIAQRMAGQDPNRADLQRELAVSHNSIGVILADLGDSAGALEEFSSGLAIIGRLCDLDPNQTRWQHDLSISHERIGGVHLARNNLPAALEAFQAAAAIRRTLSLRDPGNGEWQRELGVAYHKVGETQQAQASLDAKAKDRSSLAPQSLAAALASFRAALAVFESLAEQDPDNAELQRDVSAAHSSIGAVLLLQGDLAGALSAYRANLAISERLIDTDPDRSDWQRDLLVAYRNMAAVDTGSWSGWIGDALGIATRLAKRGRLALGDASMISDLQASLAAPPPDADPGPPPRPD